MTRYSGWLIIALCGLRAGLTHAGATGQVCPRYVQSAQWQWLYGYLSLSVVPTQCARQLPERHIEPMFNELARLEAGDSRWRNPSGLFNQLTCLEALADDEPVWHIEPARADVGNDATVDALCNPP
ncbi:DUF2599 domain-containing protein [Pseudomonas sp. dw_358]|uniref:DUF2599 domain-containing protein n=1 Tax=Pseudomonas sp. dw_358 TaxID=2720083 RepID=UPI001BD61F8E|nr:DUF2599 domain-containing protein [Pseudomonas sp. dw_358]